MRRPGGVFAVGGGAVHDPKRPEVGRAVLVNQGRAGCTGNDISTGSPSETLLWV